MSGSSVPRRVHWAVRLLDASPGDEILEIGCGPGMAVSLVCDRLAGGRITAVDRSAIAIQRAIQRNAGHVASGRAVLRQADLAGPALVGQHFDKVFAINVNLFWVRPADAEVLLIKDLLRPGGVLRLIYETPGEEQAGRVTEGVTAAQAAPPAGSGRTRGSRPP
jgi:SAM-dependent methyltransferase